MKFLIQSVENAKVISETKDWEKSESSINRGVLIYFGVSKNDINNYQEKIEKFSEKIWKTKMLKSDQNNISASLNDFNWEILIISNFTLYWENNKWAKINFSQSANFQDAEEIYNKLIEKLSEKYKVKTGIFGAMMEVSSTNFGPINYIWEY